MSTISKNLALITGVEGQDGSLLSDYLLSLNYNVVGITRRSGVHTLSENLNLSINHLNFKIELGDITDESFVRSMINKYKPELYFNLAAMSHVGQSFKEPLKTFNTDAVSVISALEAIRTRSPLTKFYQASTSEMFGGLTCPKEGYTEGFPLHPRSPYGVAKVAAYWSVRNYREAYGLFASNGILFNHSSTRRGFDFATRKITRGIAKVKLGLESELRMGNLDSFRDEAHAKDMVRGMHAVMMHEEPDDFVLATGDGATIKEMFEYVCELANLNFDDVYREDSRFMRPSDVPYLKGRPDKAALKLNWKPVYSWKDLLKEMYINDINELEGDD